MKKIKIGDKVRDKITGFEGIANAKIEYMYGCTQFEVQPLVDEHGNYQKYQWIDEPQLSLVKNNGKKKDKPRYGGMRNHPER